MRWPQWQQQRFCASLRRSVGMLLAGQPETVIDHLSPKRPAGVVKFAEYLGRQGRDELVS